MVEFLVDPFPADAALKQLWLVAWGDEGPATFQPLLERALCHVGAFDGDRLVGFVNVAWDGGVHGFILDTSVDPEYRRQGIGVGLVQRAATVARARGAQWLHVDYEPHLDGFYRQCGFRPTAAGVMKLD